MLSRSGCSPCTERSCGTSASPERVKIGTKLLQRQIPLAHFLALAMEESCLYVHWHSWIFQPADSLSAQPNLQTPGQGFISPYQCIQHSSDPDYPRSSLSASQDPFVFLSLSSVAFYPSCFFFLLSFLTTHLEKGEFPGRRLMEKILPPYLSKQGSQELFTYFLISSENVLTVLWSPQGIGFMLFCIFCLSMLAQF